MHRHIFWQPWDEPGFEHLMINGTAAEIVADGLVIRDFDAGPFRAHYVIRCDHAFRARSVIVAVRHTTDKQLVLHADGHGRWTDANGDKLLDLDGCIDVDLSATSFTNTLPIRRLDLAVGEHRDLHVVYIAVPELHVSVEPQRYTCLDRRPDGATYRYQSLDGDFTADLPVDHDGLVVDYPGLFHRVHRHRS
jgi:hypothetical protein